MEAIENETPDFAIVDFNLGSESSEDVIRELRKQEIPFVIATGYSNLEGSLADSGARAVIRKPYGTQELQMGVPGLRDTL